jgi:catechol 2,3-dioxygenase-like lactoylglutathione lyase family enzyme
MIRSLAALLLLAIPQTAMESVLTEQEAPVMDLYPIITATNIEQTASFYMTKLGFTEAFASSWFVLLSSPGPRAFSLAFMSADHPTRPPGPEAFSGKGMMLTLQVADAKARCQSVASSGVPLVHPLTDEPWGQRRCTLKDPAGVLIDIVEQTTPAPGYWERYPPRRRPL